MIMMMMMMMIMMFRSECADRKKTKIDIQVMIEELYRIRQLAKI